MMFTEFVPPNGRTREIEIIRAREIEEKAESLVKKGFKLEIELLSTGEVYMTVSDWERDHVTELIPNGPEVPEAVDRLIERAYATL